MPLGRKASGRGPTAHQVDAPRSSGDLLANERPIRETDIIRDPPISTGLWPQHVGSKPGQSEFGGVRVHARTCVSRSARARARGGTCSGRVIGLGRVAPPMKNNMVHASWHAYVAASCCYMLQFGSLVLEPALKPKLAEVAQSSVLGGFATRHCEATVRCIVQCSNAPCLMPSPPQARAKREGNLMKLSHQQEALTVVRGSGSDGMDRVQKSVHSRWPNGADADVGAMLCNALMAGW